MKLDADHFEWVEVNGSGDTSYPVHHELTVLGYDRAAGTLDMIIRFDDQGGHCQGHRHLTTTTVLVLEGEQHLVDLLPGGERKKKVRSAGEHHLTTGDPHPHLERGGPEGALVFYSHHTTDGRLYELIDENLEPFATVTIDSMIESWESRSSTV